jgi:Transposase IS116/IS110/IS902 family
VLARAQQDAVWDRTTAHNKLRSHLREYFPGFLAAFAGTWDGIMRPEARAVLAAAPTPDQAAALTLPQLRTLLKKAGRVRGIDAEATGCTPHSGQSRCASSRSSSRPWAGRPSPCCASSTPPAPARPTSSRPPPSLFNQHPDAGIITSFPGIGTLTGARVLAETGDDRSRFHDARGLKAYAGSAPITRASGKTRSVTHRKVKNNRLAAAGYTWAFAALTASPGARAHYDRRRDAGDRHTAAQRNLFNRLLGCLWHCLTTRQHYDEATAFPSQAATKTAA